MQDEINDVENTEESVLRKLSLGIQRHIANVENAMAMMRNGHFIDAYNRIGGSKEGLIHLRCIAEKELTNKTSKNNDNNIQ
jgi:hypothetical protein